MAIDLNHRSRRSDRMHDETLLIKNTIRSSSVSCIHPPKRALDLAVCIQDNVGCCLAVLLWMLLKNNKKRSFYSGWTDHLECLPSMSGKESGVMHRFSTTKTARTRGRPRKLLRKVLHNDLFSTAEISDTVPWHHADQPKHECSAYPTKSSPPRDLAQGYDMS